MRLLRLLLIPLIFVLAFFAANTPVEAACQITSFTDHIAPGATIEVSILGTQGGFFSAQIKDESGNNVGGPNSARTDPTTGVATFNLTAPTTIDTYNVEITELSLGNICATTGDIRVDPNAPTVSNPNEPAEIGGIVTIIQNIIKLLVPFAALAFLVMLTFGGFQFLLSGGDPKAAAGARSTLTFAVIGIVLVVISWLILLLVKNVTGVNVTTVEIPGIGQ